MFVETFNVDIPSLCLGLSEMDITVDKKKGVKGKKKKDVIIAFGFRFLL